MDIGRPAFATHPLAFGRRGTAAAVDAAPPRRAGDDLRLFATTFAGGFLFVSLFLA